MTNPAPQPSAPLPFKKRLERVAGRVAMLLVVRPLRALPLPAARSAGKGLGWLLYRCLGRYRRVALKNLALVYGDLPPSRRTQMAMAVFRHFGEMAAEFMKLPGLAREDVDALVVVEGEEHLKRALEMNRGGFIITGHFGNWEFLARWLTTHGYKLNVVARDARDPEATRLMTEVREGGGAQVLYRGNSARAVLQSLKRNELVALLPDQNAADVFVPFLGVSTGTVDGPAILHLKTGAPLLFSWCWRTPEDRFHIVFEAPVIVESSGDKAHDVEVVMALINARLEARIRQHPTQWLWLHDRWKATPGVFASGEWHAHELKTPTNKIKQEIEDSHGPARR
jgi:Kdo2-lipid IVA lauroyltransferase/acyltransferase